MTTVEQWLEQAEARQCMLAEGETCHSSTGLLAAAFEAAHTDAPRALRIVRLAALARRAALLAWARSTAHTKRDDEALLSAYGDAERALDAALDEEVTP